MKKHREALYRWMERAELPEEALPHVPVLQIVGFREITVEPHRGLLEYSKEQITLRLPEGEAVIRGSRLEIVQMQESRICLRGELTAVELRREAEK